MKSPSLLNSSCGVIWKSLVPMPLLWMVRVELWAETERSFCSISRAETDFPLPMIKISAKIPHRMILPSFCPIDLIY